MVAGTRMAVEHGGVTGWIWKADDGALFIGLVCWATRAIWLRRRLARMRRLRPRGAVAT